MALLFMDSFDHYATADLLTKWSTTILSGSSTGTIVAAVGRRSSGALRFTCTNNVNSTAAAKVVVASGATAIVGVATKIAATPAAVTGILSVVSGATMQVSVRLNTDMTLSVLRGPVLSGTVLGTTTATLPVNAFAYVELQVLLSATVGTVALQLNGVSVLSLSAVNTAASGTTWNQFYLGRADGGTSASNAYTQDFDDLYVLDGTGAAPWNTLLGDCRVDACYPTGAGATTGWTPSAGANWAAVDETAPNGDTDYTATATVGATDTFVTQDAPVAGAVIYGVQHCLSLKKSDAGICTVAPVIRHSGVDYPGAAVAPGTSYGYGLVPAQTNPGTGAAWTETAFNAAEFGYKRTA